MNEEKQIEEMAKAIDEVGEFVILGVNDVFIKVKVSCESVAEALYNAGYRKQEWISVDERLPEDVYGKDREQITVLVYTEGKKVSQCSRCAEYKLIEREPLERDVWRRTGNFYWNKSKRVTHWMPLPEAPKMKGGAE